DAAPEVVFSYAAQGDDHVRAPSPLVAVLPSRAPASLDATGAAALFRARPALESIEDHLAPALEPGASLPGGAGMIEAQSSCPFRALAQYRLRAEAWPKPAMGLSPVERGQLLHAALAAFWKE